MKLRFEKGLIITLALVFGLVNLAAGQGMDDPAPITNPQDSGPRELNLYQLSKWGVPIEGQAVYTLTVPGDGPIRVTLVPLTGDVDLYAFGADNSPLGTSSSVGTAPESLVLNPPSGQITLVVKNGAGNTQIGTEFLAVAVTAEPVSPYLKFDASLINVADQSGLERRFERIALKEARSAQITDQRIGFYVDRQDLPKRMGSRMTVTVTPETPSDLDIIVVGWDVDGVGTIWESRNRGTGSESLTIPVQARFNTFVVWVEAGPEAVLPTKFSIKIL